MFRCTNCGVVFVHPLPSEEFLRKLYSREGKYQRHKPSNATKQAPTARFQRFLDFIGSQAGIKKILDVGCSSGEFLYFARQRGYNVKGVEVNEATVEVARADDLDVFHGTIFEAKFSDEAFDCVVLADVIEHARDPRALLAECTRVLAPGGLMIIETPSVDCFWSRITLACSQFFGLPWSSLDPPWHLFHGTPNAWSGLAQEFGFRLSAHWYHPNPGLKHELGTLHLLKAFRQKKTIRSFLTMLLGFACYTILFVFDRMNILKKKDFAMTLIFKK